MKYPTDDRIHILPSVPFAAKKIEPGYEAAVIGGENGNRLRKRRLYVISEYHVDDKGKLRPELPDYGPCHIRNGCSCKISAQFFRSRETGPCFPLLIVKCETHNKAFTIYPPGHFPYGRQLLAPVAPNGDSITKKNGLERFEGTLFDAAMDSARGHYWPFESMENSLTPRRTTQSRHLSRTALMLGVQPGLHERLREEIKRILALPGQLYYDSTAIVNEHPDAQHQGKAICKLLNELEDSPSIFDRLAEVGANVCLWPPPKRWDPRHKRYRSSPHLTTMV